LFLAGGLFWCCSFPCNCCFFPSLGISYALD
jgi:hypothetical protein